MSHLRQHKATPFALALASIVLTTALLEPFHEQLSVTTVALALLLVILFTATFSGRNPALLAALAAMLCFNYFFLPPVRTWTIANPQNLIAWAAFILTAITAGELSAYARRRAEEAERNQEKVAKLYQELQTAFEKASHAEALRQSELLKSALLDAVTHDIRTPLTSIKAAVTALLNDEKNDEFQLDAEGKKEFLEIINEETDRLNRFTEGMVELARLEAKAVQLRRAWCSVDEIFAAALDRAKAVCKAHRVQIATEAELPAVRVDAKAIAQVVYTLLENAAKYSPPGTPIKLSAQRAPDEMIEIAVEDEGRGIPEELRERVFEKFFRAAFDTTSTTGGFGLGLAIARGIIASHAGKIGITTGAQNRGTRVAFTIPIGDEEQ
ncbi:MAG: PAS domain-containing sensor histidine kinase [Blastocatellia bacterium]|nr:PAS domain-containing sensor histidine kinase [Blastocatellia bacterium]